jgi:pilus assembly protein Flp/PilA
MKNLRKLLKGESGVDAIDYGLIAASISLVIIAVVNALGGNLLANFGVIMDKLAK